MTDGFWRIPVGILAGKIKAGQHLPLQGTDFYQHILGISSPWKIVLLELYIHFAWAVRRENAIFKITAKIFHNAPNCDSLLYLFLSFSKGFSRQ